ncbi:MAG: sugar ABC transporter substrate-binding protein [Hespellia sp.]|nr:sugar ABC transporter substrate-binding protein [Hespellia sp.]
MKKGKRKLKSSTILVILMVLLLLVSTFAVYSFSHAVRAVNLGETRGAKKYEYHFVMIHSGSNDNFWTSLYEGAKAAGEKVNAYVENFSESVPGDYSEEDLMDMAIAAKADGIIVEGSKSDAMGELINRAEDKGITVVTVLQDVADSKRRTFVGINTYSMGEIYGNQIVEALEKKQETADEDVPYKVAVLVDTSKDTAGSSLVLSGIQDTINNSGVNAQVNSVNIEKNENFESEEMIRNLILDFDNRPNVIVSLSSVDTINCNQALIDYNQVGKITILGYYSDQEVLNGIEKGVIQSSVDINANKIGSACVDNLYKYLLKGYVNEYVNVDMNLITKENVEQYLKEAQSNKGE